MRIEDALRRRAAEVDRALEALLAGQEGAIEPRLLEGMRYSLLGGGKRIRPFLAVAAAEAVGAPVARAMPFACAVEMVHAYSLVHDDLPAMDDDPVRRGRPSSHVVFGEGIAILVGDALLTEAFDVMSRQEGMDAGVVVASIGELAGAAGSRGMVGGQTADLLAEGGGAGIGEVQSIHRRKTGALIRASVRIGARVGGASTAELDRLGAYGEAVGWAFQIADDLLDETATEEVVGRATGRDRDRGKSTVPSVLGLDEARSHLQAARDEALRALEGFDERADPLRDLARFVADRAL